MLKVYSLIFLFTICIIYILSLHYKLKKLGNIDSDIKISGQIKEYPKVIGHYQEFYLNEIGVRVNSKQDLEIGDKVEIFGSLSRRVINSVYSENWLIYPNLLVLQKYENLSIKQRLLNNFLIEVKRFFYRLKENMLEKFEKLFTDDQTGLVAGMVLGMKSSLSTDLYEKMQKSGLIHIVVASGGNIAIIASFFKVFFDKIFSTKKTVILVYLVILLYLFLAGLEPPLIRASIMIGLVWISQLFGRKTSSFWVLVLTGLLMLIVKPLLIFSLSFQLSFAATGGIVLFGKRIENYIEMLNKSNFLIAFIRTDLSQTLAAFIMVLPLLIFSFGEINFVTIMSNILIAPLIVPITVGGIAILFLSYIYFGLAQLITNIFSFLLDYVLLVADICSKFNFLVFRYEILWWQVFLIWILVITVFNWISNKLIKEEI